MIDITIINSMMVKPDWLREWRRRVSRRVGLVISAQDESPQCHSTSPNTLCHPSRCPSISSTRQKYSCRPNCVESGSSCTARNPHSARPVMGSTGTRRRNRMFLPVAPAPPSATPFTKVSKVGRITLAANLDANHIAVGQVFVAIDGVAHLPQVIAQVPIHAGEQR